MFSGALASAGCTDSAPDLGDSIGSTGGNVGNGDVPLEGLEPGGNDAPRRPRDGGRIDLTAEEVDSILNAGCAAWSAEGEGIPAVLQLVVDVSGSMEWISPGSSQSKWQVTRAALQEAIEAMPASVSLGILFYPNLLGPQPSTPTECVRTSETVEIEPLGEAGSPHRRAVLQALRDARTGWATPTYDAFAYAMQEVLIPYRTSSQKFMLLITDGAPTVDQGCVLVGGGRGDAPTAPIISEIATALTEDGIRTFLIGSPGSEQSSDGIGDMRPWLSEAAISGGTPKEDCQQVGPEFCHLDMTQELDFGQALRKGLQDITGQILDSCTFQVPEPPPGETIDPQLTNVIISWGSGSSSLILADELGECADGWQLNQAGEIALCNTTCDQVKLDPRATVTLVFGCDTSDLVR